VLTREPETESGLRPQPALLFAIIALIAAPVSGQPYPSKALRIIVASTPGGFRAAVPFKSAAHHRRFHARRRRGFRRAPHGAEAD
jgi:hypothetical protein